MSRFFIALLPPKHIRDYANEVKQEFADQYASRGAQNFPPITLQPPFEIADQSFIKIIKFESKSLYSPDLESSLS